MPFSSFWPLNYHNMTLRMTLSHEIKVKNFNQPRGNGVMFCACSRVSGFPRECSGLATSDTEARKWQRWGQFITHSWTKPHTVDVRKNADSQPSISPLEFTLNTRIYHVWHIKIKTPLTQPHVIQNVWLYIFRGTHKKLRTVPLQYIIPWGKDSQNSPLI